MKDLYKIKNILINNNFYKYLITFILSIILTLIPFFLVMFNFNKNNNIIILIFCAIIQIILHLIYFLHLNLSSKKKWNLVFLIFTTIIISILVFGSIWIMNHLSFNFNKLK